MYCDIKIRPILHMELLKIQSAFENIAAAAVVVAEEY